LLDAIQLVLGSQRNATFSDTLTSTTATFPEDRAAGAALRVLLGDLQ
jgi:hypothetical protein